MAVDVTARPGDAKTAGPAPAPGPVDYALLFALACIWGASFLLIKVGVEAVEPLTLTLWRLVFAAAVMWIALLASGAQLPRTAQAWKLVVVVSVLGTVVPFNLLTWGQSGIDSGLTAIIMGLLPLITMAIAHVVLPDDRLTIWKVAGVLCGLAGVVILMGPSQLASLGDGVFHQLAIVATATCFGASAVLTRKWMGQTSQIGLATAIITLSLILMAPIAVLFEGLPQTVPPAVPLAAIAVLGVVQTGLAQILLFTLVARQGPSFFSQINFIVPLMGVGWGALILGERLPLVAFGALGLILAGLAVSRIGARFARR